MPEKKTNTEINPKQIKIDGVMNYMKVVRERHDTSMEIISALAQMLKEKSNLPELGMLAVLSDEKNNEVKK